MGAWPPIQNPCENMAWSVRSVTRTILLLQLLLQLTLAHTCEQEISEDICPQREGFDEDCERRCQSQFPLRIGSGCHLRNAGTLLSIFGIRSYHCKCVMPEAFCRSSDPIRLSYSLDSVAAHSSLVQLKEQPRCTKSSALLSCQDQFSACGWQRSPGANWYEARGVGYMPFAAGEQPEGGYLVAAGHKGTQVIWISSCDGMCSSDSVRVTAKIWKAPWVLAELCFKERTNTFCAPVNVPNGHYINETIPQTDHFQISFKFTNITEGDVIMMDEVQASFANCVAGKVDQSIERGVEPMRKRAESTERTRTEATRRSGQAAEVTEVASNKIAGPPRVFSAMTQRLNGRRQGKVDTETLKRRLCRNGDCTTISHQSSHAVAEEDSRQCVGRPGLLKCRQKCRQQGDDSTFARCIRQKQAPFHKRCVCHVRRSPVRNIQGGSTLLPMRENTQNGEVTIGPVVDDNKGLEKEGIEKNEVVGSSWTSEPELHETTCGLDRDNTECDRHCKTKDSGSSGTCSNSSLPVCECSSCFSILCDFENEAECGWTDLRLVSAQFNNISIAAKKEQTNRYGLSRMPPLTYSGLLRRGWVDGPVQLSVDVYPSEPIDVRICVDSLHKCQTQSVAARSWNRVSAKIRISRTDKIFLLFYNSSPKSDKTIAMDNISLKSGTCHDISKL